MPDVMPTTFAFGEWRVSVRANSAGLVNREKNMIRSGSLGPSSSHRHTSSSAVSPSSLSSST
eukprot:CAMPEP_0167795622 /NCGR_PEP_ID=MMETSP0111_2-20121227/14550_1 /TAXON_ID=91324 /ORGANISM="Lotharella globosa, Strain CCCM811" /LENGTH=61 /DNA_ID=CAMNT_0007689335 /DNA_START=991 /DNA_END=1176 /DNA_ORIENTATION=-